MDRKHFSGFIILNDGSEGIASNCKVRIMKPALREEKRKGTLALGIVFLPSLWGLHLFILLCKN